MSHIEFVYYDNVYNESIFTHTYNGPFVDRMEFELLNTQVPCDEEYSHITRVSTVLACPCVDLKIFPALRPHRHLLLRHVDPPDLHPHHSGAHHHGTINDDLVGGGRAG